MAGLFIDLLFSIIRRFHDSLLLSLRLSISKKVAVRSGSHKKQLKLFVFYAVNKQPVRRDMTFPETGIISGQKMIAIFFLKRFTGSEFIDHHAKKVNVVAATYRGFQIFSETG